MKNMSRILLALVLTASIGTLAKAADDKMIMIKKGGSHTAKVCAVAPAKGCATMVPIKFDDGADWSSVKDTYTVSDSTAKSLMNGKETISIDSDGKATFHSKMWMKMKKSVGLEK